MIWWCECPRVLYLDKENGDIVFPNVEQPLQVVNVDNLAVLCDTTLCKVEVSSEFDNGKLSDWERGKILKVHKDGRRGF